MLFNTTIKRQNKDYKSIPIVIISFNQLYYLKQLIDFLKKHGYYNIVILDNNSTYPPLLDYLKIIDNQVKIHRLEENYGHRVFWENKQLFNTYAKGYYVVTDPDIVPVDACPEDFLYHFKTIIDANAHVNKVGFSLKIDDIPETNKEKATILNWEKQFWEKQTKSGNYIAKIDTTFALYRSRKIYPISLDFFKAIRTIFPYIAKHGGWYIDSENLTKEQEYYIKSVNNSSSWLNNSNDGKLRKYKYYNKV
ncbi:glycosyltransferase family protein [Winogradskyella ursingii]|uniref:glycosyltransferase n=1 Tax=Winogradskyella ursingii TaxID=2686079 RepID=UPI0015CEAB5A|nr:glycosyltransferase [Winogradskyella ursingii]